MKVSLVFLTLAASVLAAPGRTPTIEATATVTITATVALEPAKTAAGPKVTVDAREAAEKARADKALKELQALEKLPFDTISYDKLPNKDYKHSDAWRVFDAARIQPDGKVEKVEKSPKKLLKRTPGGIYITTDIFWGGQKGYKVQPFNTCIVLNAPWLYTISSFGPDQGTRCDETVMVPVVKQQSGTREIPTSLTITTPIGMIELEVGDAGKIGVLDQHQPVRSHHQEGLNYQELQKEKPH
ncbi:hypothetical protein TWF281_007161 [Arthrobotrys megalospora]